MHPSLSSYRGRLAPSPTGEMHLGNAFSFLVAWLDARDRDGALLLRMEDIDPARSRETFSSRILEDLAWLGLYWDEGPGVEGMVGPYEQSRRLEKYDAVLKCLVLKDLAYPCYCTRKELRSLASAPHVGDEGAPYPGTCRALSPAGRLRMEASGRQACLRLDTEAALAGLGMSEESLFFTDALLGPQRIRLQDVGGDFALRRSDGVVAYQLAVSFDDAAMGVSAVLRGNDLLASTPRQILIHRLLGHSPPQYAHLPLVVDHLGERLAKRHSGLSLSALRQAGVAPRAVTGYLGFLAGWLDRPCKASPEEILPVYSLKQLGKSLPPIPDDIIKLLLAL